MKKNPTFAFLAIFFAALILVSGCKKKSDTPAITTSGVPTVTTSSVTNITRYSTTCGGNVTSQGSFFVLARGVCWGFTSNPTIVGNHTTDGSDTGSYVSYLTGLAPKTPYYYRAYATNHAGTAYGIELIFTTLLFDVPTVSTTPATNITRTTAVTGGDVNSDGGPTITARGVCWSFFSYPTIAGNHTTDGSDTGSFVSSLTGLTPFTLYHYRAYATNSAGTAYGMELTLTTLLFEVPLVITTPATNMTQTTAATGGVVISDGGPTVTARGVCWSTSSNPITDGDHTTDGTGTGIFVSNLTGLDRGTKYYVRAYATNVIGTAYGNQVSFKTTGINADTCPGMPTITIHHVAGTVAPVTKWVTYGTATHIPGEYSKCWITSNLGASRQATAKDDDTEASAGWYWQFNRKQGYKHDGTTRTPNTAWITSISQDLDWQAANDPCAELGSGWRIPTKTEWENVTKSGTGFDWNSDLKLHHAGHLSGSDGSLLDRGSDGYFWSSTQASGGSGWGLVLWDISGNVGYYDKPSGFSARCVRDN